MRMYICFHNFFFFFFLNPWFKMAQIWTKDRVTDEHAETAKKGVRHASPGSIDDFDSIPSTFYYDTLMVSLNEQTISSGVDENCSRAPSPEAKKSVRS